MTKGSCFTIHDFHRDEDVQQNVDQYLSAAHKHLEWATADAYGHCVCYRVKQMITIPKFLRSIIGINELINTYYRR